MDSRKRLMLGLLAGAFMAGVSLMDLYQHDLRRAATGALIAVTIVLSASGLPVRSAPAKYTMYALLACLGVSITARFVGA